MAALSGSAAAIPAPAPTVGYVRVTALAFWGVHVAAVAGVVALGWSWSGAALALGSYLLRMIVVTAGYHRYFAHRSFKTSRAFQFLLALGAQSAAPDHDQPSATTPTTAATCTPQNARDVTRR